MGESASLVLAIPHTFRDRLDGRQSLRGCTISALWCCASDGGGRLLDTATTDRPDSILKKAIGGDWKGKLSLVLYAAAIPLAFWRQWISLGLYVFAALLWLIPDRRIEKTLHAEGI